jgi:hypothetical protein
MLTYSGSGGGDRELVTSGVAGGVTWELYWLQDGDGSRHLSLGPVWSRISPGAIDGTRVVIDSVGGLPVVWGMVPAAAVAVQVLGYDGSLLGRAAVEGPELLGYACAVVVLDVGAEPARYEAVDTRGAVVDQDALVPPVMPGSDLAERIEIRVVHREDPERGTVVLEGRSDDVTWSFGVSKRPDGLWTSHEAWHPGGGGGSGSGGGRLPTFDDDHVLDFTGWGGTDGRSWSFDGVAHPSVAAVRLRLDSGAEVTVPTAGHHLGWGFVVVAASLPVDSLAVLADAIDAEGRVLERVYLTGRSSWLRQTIGEHRVMRSAAEAPVPDEVTGFVDRTIGSRMDRARPDARLHGRVLHTEVLTEAEVVERWPVRPLLLPPEATRGTWVLAATHERWEIGQVMAVGLMWVSAAVELENPDPDSAFELCERGALVMRQVLSWSSQEAWREPTNTEVGGRPATLVEMTAEVNNADHLALSWHEPVAHPDDVGSMDGLWVTVMAHPHHHPLDELRAFAESLRERR